MLLELGKGVSLLLCILSLAALLGSAFFVPGMGWEDRLLHSLIRILIAGCVSGASGLLFDDSTRSRGPNAHLFRTLPVQLYLWTLSGMTVLFFLSWYLVTYYVPMLWKNQPFH